MVNVQSPLVGLEYTPETGVYIAKLQAMLAEYANREARFRALLELLTGEQWDDVKLDIDDAGPQLMRIAEDALVLRTGLNRAEAKILVAKRWNTFNKTLEEVVVIPKAIPVEEATKVDTPASELTVYNAKERLKSWKERRQLSGVLKPNANTE
jgi:hypothetical protein